MTITERKNLPLGVGDDCSTYSESSYNNPGHLLHGTVKEVGDESFVVKWGDFGEHEYEWQKVEIIGRHIFIEKK